ncbi:MFS transporter [Streptomyces sp. Y2F8-2]|uniref:MFS transporter n=1 Tax=Streptomyces sp. Y2F8-2 TaxID=2759675 RepID=UPI001A5162D0|nr:MFS transporter [Streptomyces sp. Y2F8-2]GHK01099.1 MFS transporter [Streptomyces sp. Y2F8-2]
MSTPPSAACVRPSYAAVLRAPHVRRTLAASLVARLSYGTAPLSVMLAVTRASGSYAVAGTVLALFGATTVLLSPLRAAFVDRYGPRRALLTMALLYACVLCLLAVVSRRPGAPAPLLGALGAAAGVFPPPLGPTVRAVWSALFDDRRLVQRAYGLDAVVEELTFVAGPLLVGTTVRYAPPAAGVALSALLVTAGTIAFVTSPGVARVRPPAGSQVRLMRGRLRDARGLAQPVLVAAGAGLAVGALDLLVMAFAEQRGHGDDVVAWVLAALSAGSAVGGLLNGAVEWRGSARVRLPLLGAGLGLAVAAAGLAPGLGVLTAAVICAGLFIAPALTTSYLLADESSPADFRTQAGAWVNMAVNGGISAGSAAVGALLGHLPLGWCFAVSGAVTVAAAGLAAGGCPRARRGAGRGITRLGRRGATSHRARR